MTPVNDDNVTQMTDIHDIKPALSMGPDLQWLFWVLALLVLLGLVLLLWRLWHHRKAPRPVEPAPLPIPPDTEAYEALDTLAAQGDISAKQFYFRLSAIIRRYIERRYDFPAAEMTTEELLPRINRLQLNKDLADTLKIFCRSADPIKFAGEHCDGNQMRDDLAFARSFVQQTSIIEKATGQGAPAPDGSDLNRPSEIESTF
jgi:hypothetical protein